MRRLGARFFVLGALVGLTNIFLRVEAAPLRAGEYTWNPEFSASGPLVIIISLREQTLSVYRNGIRIARSSISSGRKGRSTPEGVFTILEKEVTHFSNKYHHAPTFLVRICSDLARSLRPPLPSWPAAIVGACVLAAELARWFFYAGGFVPKTTRTS